MQSRRTDHFLDAFVLTICRLIFKQLGGGLVDTHDALFAVDGNHAFQHTGKYGFELIALIADGFNTVIQLGGHLVHGVCQAGHFFGGRGRQAVA